MNFDKFWDLVKKHNWLLSVIARDYLQGLWEDGRVKSLSGLTCFFDREAVTKTIRYVAFRPWNTLDYQSFPELKTHVTEETKIYPQIFQEMRVRYELYYHLEGTEPFSDRLCVNAEHGMSIGEVIDSLSIRVKKAVRDTGFGGKVQVVVKVTARAVEHPGSMLHFAKETLSDKFQETHDDSYDIYLYESDL